MMVKQCQEIWLIHLAMDDWTRSSAYCVLTLFPLHFLSLDPTTQNNFKVMETVYELPPYELT